LKISRSQQSKAIREIIIIISSNWPHSNFVSNDEKNYLKITKKKVDMCYYIIIGLLEIGGVFVNFFVPGGRRNYQYYGRFLNLKY
jgi:hypothetical protein